MAGMKTGAGGMAPGIDQEPRNDPPGTHPKEYRFPERPEEFPPDGWPTQAELDQMPDELRESWNRRLRLKFRKVRRRIDKILRNHS